MRNVTVFRKFIDNNINRKSILCGQRFSDSFIIFNIIELAQGFSHIQSFVHNNNRAPLSADFMTISILDRKEFNARSSLSGKFGLNLTARASPREVRLLAVIELELCKMESIASLVVILQTPAGGHQELGARKRSTNSRGS